MKTLKTIAILSLTVLSLIALVVIGNGISEASAKIEAERMATAKVMCESGSKWVKIKGELNTRNCETFKR